MKIIKGFLASTGILSTLLLSNPAQAQKQTNTVSTCYVTSHQAVLNEGKCIIRSRLEGNNILVTIEKSWGKTRHFQLSNPYMCDEWSSRKVNKDCFVEEILEARHSYDWVSATLPIIHFGRNTNSDSENLYYEYGGGHYNFFYQGKFKKPFIDPCKGVPEKYQAAC